MLKHKEKKHGQDIFHNVRALEQLKTKWCKINKDINFIEFCKKAQLTPTFAKVKLVIRSGNAKLMQKLVLIIMQTEIKLKDQHTKKIS